MARPEPPRGASAEDKARMAEIAEGERNGGPAPAQATLDATTTTEQPYRPDGSRRPPSGVYGGAGGAPAPLKAEGKQGADTALGAALDPQLGLDLGGAEAPAPKALPGLADKFIVPPFSVLDTRAGYWQERRRQWLSLGFRGETGRSTDLAYGTVELMTEGLKAEQGLGRKQGLIYQHDAPASDPGFYTKKTAIEKRLDRTLTTEEFKRDHYSRDDEVGAAASQSVATGTSVFDPILCEVAYRWFSGVGAQILDPFAGGVVRGAAAAILGRKYAGVELRPEQIADNRAQAAQLFGASGLDFGREVHMPQWHEGDATKLEALDLPMADLVFTCPPYADLEVYSDNPADLSTMKYEAFRQALAQVMADSAAMLKPNRFSVWVVGEARDKKTGLEYGLVPDTIKAAQAAGMGLYNSAILVNSVGSAALRAQRIIRTRKVTRVHQHVLVFVKGDPRKAAEACGNAEVEV